MPHRPMVHQFNVWGKSNTCDGNNEDNILLNNAYASDWLALLGVQIRWEIGIGGDQLVWETVSWIWISQQHPLQREGEQPHEEHSLRTEFWNWNPSPLGFQMALDAFTYVNGMGVLMALELIERD